MTKALRHDLRSAIAPFFWSRLWIALWVYIGHATSPYRQPTKAAWVGVDNWWLNPWTTYDSQHFMQIAASGYVPHTTPFFPLYPLFLRVFASDEITMAAWGVFLSNLCLFGALALLHHLTRREHNKKTATLCLWLLAFFPTSAIFSAVYTDSLYLLCLVAAFVAARRQSWFLAGAAAFLASLTRNAGPVIALSLLLECYLQNRNGLLTGRRQIAIAVGNSLLPLCAVVMVQCYLSHRFGGLPGVSAHELYGRAWMPPWQPLWHEALNILSGNGLDIVTLANFAATMGALILVWRWRVTIRPSYQWLILGVLLMQLTLGRVAGPFTNTSLRLLSTAFPFAQCLALQSAPLTQNRLRLVLSAIIYIFVCAVFSFLFGQRQFVCG